MMLKAANSSKSRKLTPTSFEPIPDVYQIKGNAQIYRFEKSLWIGLVLGQEMYNLIGKVETPQRWRMWFIDSARNKGVLAWNVR
jgi:hypothetical protein